MRGLCFNAFAHKKPTQSTAQVSNINITSIDWDRATINFTNGGGVDRIVVMSLTPITSVPVNKIKYDGNLVFGSGNETTWDNYVVGNSSGIVVTGLSQLTTYYVRAFEIKVANSMCNAMYVTPDNSVSFTTIEKPFEPSDIAWKHAFLPADLSGAGYDTTDIWINRGSTVGNAIQNGANPLPVYNSGEGALEFTRASSQQLIFQKPNPVMTQPFTYFIRLKRKSIGNTQTVVGYSNGYPLGFVTANTINSVAGTTLTDTSSYHIIEIIFKGVGSTITIDGGTPVTFTSNTYSHGAELARLGSSFTDSNYFDGYISHLWIGTPNDTELGKMRTWISENL